MSKRTHRSLALVLGFVLLFSIMGAAQAADTEADPNRSFTVGDVTKTYPLTVSPSEPCIRIWAKNTDSKGELIVRLLDENGGVMGSTEEISPGGSDTLDTEFTGGSTAKWQIEVMKKSDDTAEVTGMLAARMESDWTKFDYDHAPLDAGPYIFATSAESPYFRLWIRNTSSHQINGTISYADGSIKAFSVAAADPVKGYSDYNSDIINPGAGKHTLSLRGAAGYAISGAMSIRISAYAHFWSVSARNAPEKQEY